MSLSRLGAWGFVIDVDVFAFYLLIFTVYGFELSLPFSQFHFVLAHGYSAFATRGRQHSNKILLQSTAQRDVKALGRCEKLGRVS